MDLTSFDWTKPGLRVYAGLRARFRRRIMGIHAPDFTSIGGGSFRTGAGSPSDGSCQRGGDGWAVPADLRLFRLRRAELHLYEERPQTCSGVGGDERATRLYPHPFMLATGDGTPGLKRGSTNAYTEMPPAGRCTMDHLRPDFRYLFGGRRQALRGDRIHAAGALVEAGAISADLDSRRGEPGLCGWLVLISQGLQQVG